MHHKLKTDIPLEREIIDRKMKNHDPKRNKMLQLKKTPKIILALCNYEFSSSLA